MKIDTNLSYKLVMYLIQEDYYLHLYKEPRATTKITDEIPKINPLGGIDILI